MRQTRIEFPAVAAELIVVAVTEGEHGIVQMLQTGSRFGRERLPEVLAVVGRIPVAEGAAHQQQVLRLGQRPQLVVRHAGAADVEARFHQRRRVPLAQRFDIASLRGPQQGNHRTRTDDFDGRFSCAG
ncbi:hypothetical protein D3C81_1476260 [compost metagenome]